MPETAKDNIFYQPGFAPTAFPADYILLRKKENRVFTDETVRSLPDIAADHPMKKEWDIRKHSLQKLIGYLREKKSVERILELGCGNGWLSHRLAISLPARVYAMDVNETELTQGSAIFNKIENLNFILGDVFSFDHKQQRFDIIVLAASIQYFPDFTRIVKKLLTLLEQGGEIHLLDSPFYDIDHLSAARKRSAEYFSLLGFPQMKEHYHHHAWHSLKEFNCEILYDPATIINRIKKHILPMSPFPWIKITSVKGG